MQLLIYQDEKKRSWIKITPETTEEGFWLGYAWGKERNHVNMIKNYDKPVIEIELLPVESK